jgi:alanine dehydrogenase
MRSAPSLRYLPAADLERAMPSVLERIDLAAVALRAVALRDAEMPPKIGVHPREGALIHAMPAWLRSADIAGLKWVSAFPGNRGLDLPAVTGLVVLNDAETGFPTWVMEAARITAVRTAAVSGVAIRLFQPADVRRVAILGAGVQAHSHAEVVGALLPDAELMLFDRNLERARTVVDEWRDVGRRAVVGESAESTTRESQLVITAATLSKTQLMTPSWVGEGTLVVSIDFATYASAALASAASAFVVDDRDQFLAYRANGYFDGFPEPTATLGEMLDQSRPGAVWQERPRIHVNHLGIGLADVVLADAIARRAAENGSGMKLEP